MSLVILRVLDPSLCTMKYRYTCSMAVRFVTRIGGIESLIYFSLYHRSFKK